MLRAEVQLHKGMQGLVQLVLLSAGFCLSTAGHARLCLALNALVRCGAGVDVVTLGQYMRPTKRHMAVAEYVTPATFSALEAAAKDLGFLYVAAGPLVRSSYRAGEYFLTNVLRGSAAEGPVSGDEQAAAAAGA